MMKYEIKDFFLKENILFHFLDLWVLRSLKTWALGAGVWSVGTDGETVPDRTAGIIAAATTQVSH